MFDYNTMRYVHLDFHTPEFVKVGEKFNADEFADTVEKASINTMAIFALCHHGHVYYDTKVGVPHPQLKADLVGGMTKALRKKGIQSLIYFSQNVNETLSAAHPECARRHTGQLLQEAWLSEFRYSCPSKHQGA